MDAHGGVATYHWQITWTLVSFSKICRLYICQCSLAQPFSLVLHVQSMSLPSFVDQAYLQVNLVHMQSPSNPELVPRSHSLVDAFFPCDARFAASTNSKGLQEGTTGITYAYRHHALPFILPALRNTFRLHMSIREAGYIDIRWYVLCSETWAVYILTQRRCGYPY